MFLRFVGLGSRFFGLMTILSFPLMIVHFFAKNLDNISNGSDSDVLNISLNVLTIQNVARGSNIFFVHAVFAYIISGYVYYLLYKTWLEYIELRKHYFSGSDYLNSFRNKVLLFTSNEYTTLPDFQRHLATLDLCFPPEQVLLGRDYSELGKLVEKHFELTCNYEKVLCKYLSNPNHVRSQTPTHKEGATLGICGGEEVDSIDFYRRELLSIEEQIYKERAKRDEDFLPDSSVFVAFGDIVQAHTNARKLIQPYSRNALYQLFNPHPNVKVCPDFDDILWDNIGLNPHVKRTRKLIATGLTIGLTIGWVFINSLLAAMSNSINFNFLPPEFSGLGVFLQSILVPVLTAILNILLPIILRHIAKLQGVVSESGVERSALIKFFVFQVYQYLIQIGFAVISGFATNFFRGRLRDGDIEALLKSLTSNAVISSMFFVTYIASGITFYGIEIIQGMRRMT
jgi:calcium permeable stress-gated cation channel